MTRYLRRYDLLVQSEIQGSSGATALAGDMINSLERWGRSSPNKVFEIFGVLELDLPALSHSRHMEGHRLLGRARW